MKTEERSTVPASADSPGRKALPRAVEWVHRVLRRVVQPDDMAIDATVGNGLDTLLLARRVGPAGRVYGFDVQDTALRAARRLLEQEGLSERVELHRTGHEHMEEALPRACGGSVRAVVFNLGYLPGGDKRVITRAPSTLRALEAALRFLTAGGVVTVVAYRGHPGGAEEADAVLDWARALDRERFAAARYNALNTAAPAPVAIAVVARPHRPDPTRS